jgi:hypothetical protein
VRCFDRINIPRFLVAGAQQNLFLAKPEPSRSSFLQSERSILAADGRPRADEEVRITLATHPRTSMLTADGWPVSTAPDPALSRPASPALRDKLFKKMTRG